MTTLHSAGVIPEFTLGDRLRKARELTGLSIRRFADEIGVIDTRYTKGHLALVQDFDETGWEWVF
jgi:hypothetical protein